MNSTIEAIMPILRDNPNTRNSDDELLLEYSKRYLNKTIDLRELGISFKLLKNIERSRRKIQEANPQLKAIEEVQQQRNNLENAFRETGGNWEV